MFTQKLKLLPALLAAGLLAAGAVMAGSGDNEKDKPDPPPPAARAPKAADAPDRKAERPPVVRVVKPRPGGLERATTQACVAHPVRQADLVPAVAGTVREVNVALGDHVKAGQVLARIDAPPLELDERLARVTVAQAEGLLKQAQARVARAKAEVRLAQGGIKLKQTEADRAKASLDLRKRQVDRLRELFKTARIDYKAVEEAEAQRLTAEGLLEAATAGIENAKADLLIAEGKLQEAEAAVDTAKANVETAKLGLEKVRAVLAQTEVRAPFAGVVAVSNANAGDAVRPGPGVPAMFTVMKADVLRIVVGVPEHDMPATKPGVEAEVTVDAFRDLTLKGTVARVGFAVDPVSRKFHAEIDLPNPDERFRPGMTGAVTLKLGQGPAGAVRVPATSLLEARKPKSGESFFVVYVYRGGKARLRRVELSYSRGPEVEVSSGLTATDLVVADANALFPGPPPAAALPSEVEVKVEEAPPGK